MDKKIISRIKIDSATMQSINAYIEEVKKHYNVKYVILFGSYAKGTAHEDSDIDIAVVASNITNRFEDGVNMAVISHDYGDKLEVHAMPLEDYEKTDTILAFEVRRTGIPLYAA